MADTAAFPATATATATTTAINIKQASALCWFEIPAHDLERAQAFYEKLLGAPMSRENMGPNAAAVFAYGESGVGGCVMTGPDVPAPRTDGAMVYLNAAPTLDVVLARVQAAGGRITTPKVALPGDMGVFAHIIDSEGNRVGLHALTSDAAVMTSSSKHSRVTDSVNCWVAVASAEHVATGRCCPALRAPPPTA
jgi:uncharacterized protein